MPVAGGANIPFRRMTDPLVMPVGPTAARFDVPAGFFDNMSGITSFYVVNPNNFWVRLKGSATVTDTTGWLWSPGFQGVFTTQFPAWMSTLSVARQGLSAGSGFIELSYGLGE